VSPLAGVEVVVEVQVTVWPFVGVEVVEEEMGVWSSQAGHLWSLQQGAACTAAAALAPVSLLVMV
jgi:hypothetical protein